MRYLTVSLLLIGLANSAGPASAATVSLASTMSPNGFLSENAVTGAQAQINFGNGGAGDNDGLYDISNLSQQFGSIDLFPREAAFRVGSVDYNAGLITGVGIESTAITSLNLALLWTSGSNTTDISDGALGDWFFDQPRSFSFGALDAADRLTFTNGALTSISLSTTAAFSLQDFAGNTVTWSNGTFGVTGNQLSFAINDTRAFNLGAFGGGMNVQSNFITSLNGTVSSVTAVPEPSSMAMLAIGGGIAAVIRRTRNRKQSQHAEKVMKPC